MLALAQAAAIAMPPQAITAATGMVANPAQPIPQQQPPEEADPFAFIPIVLFVGHRHAMLKRTLDALRRASGLLPKGV